MYLLLSIEILTYNISSIISDSYNLTVLNTMNQNSRDMIFRNNGQIIVVTSFYDDYNVFLINQNSSRPSYIFTYQHQTNYSGPHGLQRVNDSFFYASSWENNMIYSYTATGNSTL
jgi:hypothetical protein